MTAVTERATVEDRLDRLSAQVEAIAADLQRQREAREQWQELAETLVPVGQGAFDLASRELDDLSTDVTIDDAVRFARTMARSLPQLEALVGQLQSMTDLISEVTSLSGAGVARLSGALAEADRKGYFVVARGGAAVVDRVVTSYADEDFEAFGDTLMLVLGVAKEMASAEVVGVLGRTMVALREGQQDHAEPPSTLGLLRQLRDPQARRGLARALALLQAVGAEPGTDAHVPSSKKG